MRKPTIFIGENKNADQLGGYSTFVFITRCSLTFTLNQFSYRVINVWNSLPQHVVDAETLNSFKARLDKHWQGNMVYEY